MSLYIWLDAGHGGKDPGATGHGLQEADVVLKLCKYLNDALGAYEGVKVSLTRWQDKYVSLNDRCKMANAAGADVFISMHNNSFSDSSAHGYESFVLHGAYSSTQKWRGVVHDEVMGLLKEHGIRDRGKKEAGFYVIKYTKMTACLFENLFISNPKEAKLLGDNNFLMDLARAYARGLAKAFNLKEKEVQTPEKDSGGSEESGGDSNDEWVRVQINGEQKHAFNDPNNAVKWVKDTVKAGDVINIKR